jgi:selenophosphate synthase
MGAVILLGVMADQILSESRNRRQIKLMQTPNPIAADHSGGTGSEPIR